MGTKKTLRMTFILFALLLIFLSIATRLTKEEPSTNKEGIETQSLGINQLNMIDTNNGWAMNDSLVLRTEDGGHTWSNVTPDNVTVHTNPSLKPAAVFIDKNNAYLAIPQEDSYIKIFKTINGGEDWETTAIHSTFSLAEAPYISAFQFIDNKNGFLLIGDGLASGSEPIEVYKTTDGSQSWQLLSITSEQSKLPHDGLKSGIAFLDMNNGWVTGNDSSNQLYLYRTVDGGNSWRKEELKIPDGFSVEGEAPYTLPPNFLTIREGFLPIIFHQGGQPTFFYRTSDGGDHWEVTTPIYSDLNYRFIWSIIDKNTIIASDENSLFITKDGAKTWEKNSIHDIQNITLLDFLSISEGWMVGEEKLYKTNDGGRSWTKLESTIVN